MFCTFKCFKNYNDENATVGKQICYFVRLFNWIYFIRAHRLEINKKTRHYTLSPYTYIKITTPIDPSPYKNELSDSNLLILRLNAQLQIKQYCTIQYASSLLYWDFIYFILL